MKSTTILYSIIILSVGFLLGCANLETAGTQSQGLPKTEQTSAAKTPLVEKTTSPAQSNDILSRDYKTAENALGKALADKKNEVVKLGLQSPILAIRLKTADAVRELDDTVYVPSLIAALEDNRGIMDGGSETQNMQRDLTESLVAGLEKLTKMKFNISEQLTPEDIQEVLKKSGEWWEVNKKDFENTETKSKPQ